MTQTNTHEVAELLPGYAAGSLPYEDAEGVAQHLAGCESCQAELTEWQAIAGGAQRAAGAAAPSRGLLERTFARIDAPETGQARSPILHAWFRPALWAGGVAAVLALAFLTPAGSIAKGLLDSFQPKRFVVVPVSPAALRALPKLNDYGEFSQVSHGKPQEFTNPADAAAASGLKLVSPTTLPAGVPSAPSTYQFLASSSATFTFNAAKAGETAKASGKTLPPMPANIDGSSVQLTTANAVAAVYGDIPKGSADPMSSVPKLIVGQVIAPTVTSTGASPKELQQYLLSLPGFPDELAEAIKAIGDPTTTWPIPVPAGKVNSHTAMVGGAQATVFSDDGGFMTGVVWLNDGMIYGVGGPQTEADILKVAGSLH